MSGTSDTPQQYCPGYYAQPCCERLQVLRVNISLVAGLVTLGLTLRSRAHPGFLRAALQPNLMALGIRPLRVDRRGSRYGGGLAACPKRAPGLLTRRASKAMSQRYRTANYHSNEVHETL